MRRYIDADEFADFIKRWGQGSSLEDVIEWLETGDTADVVEVVHCQDCKYYGHYNEEKEDLLWCQFVDTDIDDYCSYGERKEA